MNKTAGQKMVSAFRANKCWMIKPLAERMNYSIPSVRRFLSKTGYFSSFTHNGKWYTLASIPQFSSRGLWFYRDIGFSKYGSLTHTLINLVENSASGMTADQLGQLVRCRCHGVLVHLCRKGQLQRQKHGGCYVYLSINPVKADIQEKALQPHHAALSAELAVQVLVAFIRSPGSDFRQLAKVVFQKTGTMISTEQIQMLFDVHGIKKKT
jgi:predicted transcriptional regulator